MEALSIKHPDTHWERIFESLDEDHDVAVIAIVERDPIECQICSDLQEHESTEEAGVLSGTSSDLW